MISENANKFCRDNLSNIENYDKAIDDPERVWHCHHRFETFWWFSSSKQDLIDEGLYYARPASEFIFLTPEEHKHIHCGRGIKLGFLKKPRWHSLQK